MQGGSGRKEYEGARSYEKYGKGVLNWEDSVHYTLELKSNMVGIVSWIRILVRLIIIIVNIADFVVLPCKLYLLIKILRTCPEGSQTLIPDSEMISRTGRFVGTSFIDTNCFLTKSALSS